jgi:hypothetical protein
LHRSEQSLRTLVFVDVNPEKLQRIAFVKVPDLIGQDPVPATALPGPQQEIDCRERIAVRTIIFGPDLRYGSVHLGVRPALRMRN